MNTIRTLEEALCVFDQHCYLITVSDFGPHNCAVEVEWVGGELWSSISETAISNIRQTPQISLIWPAIERGGYSLIVNAIASEATDAILHRVRLDLTKAVLHRAGEKPPGRVGACRSDCVPLSYPPTLAA